MTGKKPEKSEESRPDSELAEESGYQRDDYLRPEQEGRSPDDSPKTDKGLSFQDNDEKQKAASSPASPDTDA